VSSGSSLGVELVLELVRAAAEGRRCPSCDRPLTAATIEPDAVDLERIVARLVCACGAVEVVEIRPASEEGRAELR
jgi:hypothetical protein